MTFYRIKSCACTVGFFFQQLVATNYLQASTLLLSPPQHYTRLRQLLAIFLTILHIILRIILLNDDYNDGVTRG